MTYPAPRTFPTKRDAELWLVDTEAELRRDGWQDPNAGRVSLGTYAALWIDERSGLSEKTQDLYRWLLRRCIAPDLGSVELADLTPPRVRAWRKKLLDDGVSEVTAAKGYRLLKSMLNTAVDDDLIRRNPCRIKGGGIERSTERTPPTMTEVFALADAIGTRWRALVLVAAFCGLRWGELVGLRRRDIDLKTMTIHVDRSVIEVNGKLIEKAPKTAAGKRVVGIPEVIGLDVRRQLRRWSARGRDGLVFPALGGGFLRRSNFARRQWSRAAKDAGVPGMVFHALRHAAATWAAQTGATIRELMEFLGHTSPRAALIYQHSATERARRIAEGLSGEAANVRSASKKRAHKGHDVRGGKKSS